MRSIRRNYPTGVYSSIDGALVCQRSLAHQEVVEVSPRQVMADLRLATSCLQQGRDRSNSHYDSIHMLWYHRCIVVPYPDYGTTGAGRLRNGDNIRAVTRSLHPSAIVFPLSCFRRTRYSVLTACGRLRCPCQPVSDAGSGNWVRGTVLNRFVSSLALYCAEYISLWIIVSAIFCTFEYARYVLPLSASAYILPG